MGAIYNSWWRQLAEAHGTGMCSETSSPVRPPINVYINMIMVEISEAIDQIVYP